jgi:DnaJ-class molecular chaperone
MGLHLCPIEPDDWANGPSDSQDECPVCNGAGVVDADLPGVHDAEMTCERCGGTGFIDIYEALVLDDD